MLDSSDDPARSARASARGASGALYLYLYLLRLDLDLYSDDDSEDREYVHRLFEDECAEAMSYEGHE